MLIEPRDERVDLQKNPDLIKYAQNSIAAERLAQTADDAARRDEFTKIGNDDKKGALEYLRKTTSRSSKSRATAHRRPSPSFSGRICLAAAREQIIQHVLRQLYPPAYVQEHLAGRAAELVGRKVSQVEEEYRNTPRLPDAFDADRLSRGDKEPRRSRKCHRSPAFCRSGWPCLRAADAATG